LTIDSRIALVDHLGPRLWNVEAGVESEVAPVKEQAIFNPGKAILDVVRFISGSR
jgi:hypothetical protein